MMACMHSSNCLHQAVSPTAVTTHVKGSQYLQSRLYEEVMERDQRLLRTEQQLGQLRSSVNDLLTKLQVRTAVAVAACPVTLADYTH